MKQLIPFFLLLLPFLSFGQDEIFNDSEAQQLSFLDTIKEGSDDYFEAYETFLSANLYAAASKNMDSLSNEYIKVAKQFNKPNYQIRGMYIRAIILSNIRKYTASLKLLQVITY